MQDVAMAEATLLRLPQEVLDHIAAQITHLRDVSALVRASRRCHDLLGPTLYRLDAKSAMPRALVSGAHRGAMDVVEKALRAGSDVDAVYGDSWHGDREPDPETTPLLAAAKSGHLEIVRRLADAGADGRWLDMAGHNALGLAAVNGHEEVVKLLLARFLPSAYDVGCGYGGLPAVYAAPNKAMFHLILEAMDPVMCGSSLEKAAVLGYEDIFYWLLERGVEVDLERWQGRRVALLTSVCRGTSQSHVRIAQFLIDQGMLIEGSPRGETPLYAACLANGPNVFEMVNMLLENGADVASLIQNTSRQLPMRAACSRGNLELTRLLFAHPDALTEPPGSHDVAYMEQEACARGDIDCYKFIVENFHTDSLLSRRGTHLLTMACSRPPPNIEMVKLLLERGAKVNDGEDAEQVGYPLTNAWRNGSLPIMKLLIDAGASPNTGQAEGMPLLCQPTWPSGNDQHQIACLEFILSLGADPVAKTAENRTPLHSACQAGAVGCVQLLLEEHGADATAACTNGITPLHMAVQSGNIEIVKMLVAHGADVSSRYEEYIIRHDDNTIRTALHDACQLDEPDDMVEYLIATDAETQTNSFSWGRVPETNLLQLSYAPLCLLVENDDVKGSAGALELLLSADHDPEILNMALSLACRDGKYGTAKVLLDRGADPNTKWRSKTPLCEASRRSAALVHLLISHGADVNTPSIFGVAPLYTAVSMPSIWCPSITCLRFLLGAGAVVSLSWAMPSHDQDLYFPGGDSPVVHPEVPAAMLADRLPYVLNARAVELLLDEGGLLETLPPGAWQDILLQAVEWGNANLVRLLVDRELADIGLPDRHGVMVESCFKSEGYWGEVKDTIRHIIFSKKAA